MEYKAYKPPSTIPEESTTGPTSPFDTPGSTASIRVVIEGDGSPRNPEARAHFRAQAAAAQKSDNNTLLCPGRFSPLRSDPSHPDLVPQPLAVIKRNSFRGSSSPHRFSWDYDLHQKSLRRWSSTSVTPSTVFEREKVLARSNRIADARDEAETKDAEITGKFSEPHCREVIANAPPASKASAPPHITARPDLTGNPFSTPPLSFDHKTPESEKPCLSIPQFPTPPTNEPFPFWESEMGWQTHC